MFVPEMWIPLELVLPDRNPREGMQTRENTVDHFIYRMEEVLHRVYALEHLHATMVWQNDQYNQKVKAEEFGHSHVGVDVCHQSFG